METPNINDFLDLKNYGMAKKINTYRKIIVTVDQSNREEIESLAKRRTEANRYHHRKATVLTKDYEKIGVLGEFSFEVLTEVPMDRRIGILDKYDFKINEKEIDIKATENGRELPVKEHRLVESPNYLYVYTRVNQVTYECEFLGYLPGNKIKINGIDENGVWRVPQKGLHSMEELERMLGGNGIFKTGRRI